MPGMPPPPFMPPGPGGREFGHFIRTFLFLLPSHPSA